MFTDLIFNTAGHIGTITLNRPTTLNALTWSMIKALQEKLLQWQTDHNIHAVVIKANPGKAFCAGGDVRWLYKAGLAKDQDQLNFFRHEYNLNYFISQLNKPYIAMMDGITMGGGVGISLHGAYPIASEHFVFAMPETGIGFFPDIGASFLLTRLPEPIGVYLGLTGRHLAMQDAYSLGLIKYIIPAAVFTPFLNTLSEIDLSINRQQRISDCIQKFAITPTTSIISSELDNIKLFFKYQRLEEIFNALNKDGGIWATTTLQTLMKKSPLSLKITLAQLQKAKTMSLAECLAMDYCLVAHFMRGNDFYEGVRALLIDQDKCPHWQPNDLALVSNTLVEQYFH